jgi:hypothetical protein
VICALTFCESTHYLDGFELFSFNLVYLSKKNLSFSSKTSPLKKKRSRKTLKSLEAKPYDDLYLGKGKPEIEPD